MQQPITFSALLSVYKNDQPETLDICLESLYKQTVALDEVIVVQEGDVSTGLNACLKKWEGIFKHKFSWYQLPFQNGPMGFGLPSCLNYGIQHAKSTHIFRVDTDDVNLQQRAQVQMDFLTKNPNVKLLGAYVQEFSEDMAVPSGIRAVPVDHKSIKKKSIWRNPFNGPAVVFDKQVALQLGGFPIIPSNEDYCFWANFLLNGYETANIPEVLVHMRAGDGLLLRRSSKRYRLGEIESLKYLKKVGLFSTPIYIFHRLSKLIVRNLPSGLIKFIYNSILRN